MNVPRVAFFTDSFHEANGVALTSREFARHAQEQDHPFLSVHAGPETRLDGRQPGDVRTQEQPRRRGVRHEPGIRFVVPAASAPAAHQAKEFPPGPDSHYRPRTLWPARGDFGSRLGVPVVASWHTNLHEFAGRRLDKLLYFFGPRTRRFAHDFAERKTLDLIVRFYRLGRLLFAPNPELVDMLKVRTGRPTHLMLRGIDTALFSPLRRDRGSQQEFVIGYVGRLSPEKNVRLLREIERGLVQAGLRDYRFLVVCDGSERPWLAANVGRCELPGILRGADLARAYASMDAFVFPSETDTFGNVVLEAMSSGVPPIVGKGGGPKYLVQSGVNGYSAASVEEFVGSLLRLKCDPELRKRMSSNARLAACSFSWSAVFEGVYRQYAHAFACGQLYDRRNQNAAIHPKTPNMMRVHKNPFQNRERVTGARIGAPAP
jgi:phosphatidylinositol alpha 1,6-mannosyltransferase